MPPGADRERRGRSGIAALLGYGEFVIDMAVALALIAGGTILLGVVVYDFVRGLGHEPVVGLVLELLSGLLLVFIFTELVSTIRVVIARRKVVVEPFLIVGIVAAIRRLIVISAEAENLLGTAKFRDLKRFAPSDDMTGVVPAAWRHETNRLPPQRPRSA